VLRSSPWFGWPLWNIYVTNDHGYLPLVNTSRSFPCAWLITGFVTTLTPRVSRMEQELLTLLEHMSSPQVIGVGSCYSVFSFMYVLCRSLFVHCTFSVDHCIFSSSSIYGFWLPLSYLQTLLLDNEKKKKYIEN
jgi:hypothetical protein